MLFKVSVYKSPDWQRLTKSEKAVVSNLVSRADETKTCYPKIKTIAKDMSLHKDTVATAIKGLSEKFPEFKTRRMDTSSIYDVSRWIPDDNGGTPNPRVGGRGNPRVLNR
ncbi:MAG: hypothetical protein A2487_13535 [Candidatus Raymondbacteria bacterium RifOxyC12_full_50_8]|uniref:Uncharacterized protein n=1 Tax=Candidatus Raymondbacteria bacterium RIFOXYD12_FULL_49_13 TaxID=1817890 RepID=A0A1F7F7V0_UNCRA|nr:MAG: hypothetical protein A2248_13645 [Candidatus Raymondbacteria bacterium RIFOXYA2_FULL_49_16]OGJ95169.1 MAG: hypothetical protein A2350_09500 [Candidatus Raymondbacteria bacterium RifOxyB12_full_50_8]OGK00381.1 MAG: hypothetical protein A2487_13535 [Candidatus Raymondbacteria bacterium RifOxyC12_full_50_8]OGK02703.1 MAG: hypothetical protein A2519_09580 [Candidatus Raymondbacteria bacterium RIFOXYD12_FULL_49_13]OGP42349.1 MAG: hypothetical protein A2324_20250 [Candidatus Raymondbacteria b